MIIKKIEITNIRSYKDKTTIELPIGRILFQGDIGSGKSTILSAIEFALFGLGDIDANHLLRIGEIKGSVLLEFESSGKTYQVFRSLSRKGNKISQEEGFLYENGVKNSYSVGELKSRILDVIGINEKTQTKTTSAIYRFAIYTPQEMMKSVLTSSNEKRVEILRRAFGIEEYSTAKKNAEKFFLWIRTVTRIKKSMVNDLTTYKLDLKKIRDINEILREEIHYFNDRVEQINVNIQTNLRHIHEMREKKERVLRVESMILHLQSTIDKNSQLKDEMKLELGRLSQELYNISQSQRILIGLEPKYQDFIKKRHDLLKVTEKASEYDKLLLDKVKLESDISIEHDKLNSTIQRLELDITDLSLELGKCNEEIKNLDKLLKEELVLKNKISDSNSLQVDLDKTSDVLSNTRSEINSINNEISAQKSELDTVLQLKQDAICPYCKQKLNQQHIMELENKFLLNKDILKAKITDRENKITNIQEEKNKILDKIREAECNKSDLQKAQIQIAKLLVVQKTITQLENKINEKISNKKSLQDKLQDNHLVDKIKKLNGMDSKLDMLSSYKSNYDDLNKLVNNYQKMDLERKYMEHYNMIKSKQRVSEEIRTKETALLTLNAEIMTLSKKLAESKSIFQDSEIINMKLKELETEKVSFENELMKRKEDLAIRRTDQDNNTKQIEIISNKIVELEEKIDKIIFTDQIGIWLDQYFIPSLEQIESQVLISVKEEFNKLFQKWFYLLIEVGDIDVEIDEFFTPLVNQNGYYLEVESLSGGEKTSIALAYRLALNEIIRRMIMLDDSLLILDEPTDGFSKEQLIQIKHVLEELNASQVIIVSHEKELEGFVETIFRVVKECEQSQVELVI